MSDLDLSQGVETGFKATIAETGEYTLAVELINAGTYETIDEAGVKAFTVAEAPEEPEVAFEFNGFEDFVAGVEKSFSVKVTATGIDETTALKYKATFKKGEEAVEGQAVEYQEGEEWKTFTTDSDGVAYFGPSDGFTMKELDLSDGRTTEFKATIAEEGNYTLTVELVEVATDETIDEAGEKTFEVATE